MNINNWQEQQRGVICLMVVYIMIRTSRNGFTDLIIMKIVMSSDVSRDSRRTVVSNVFYVSLVTFD